MSQDATFVELIRRVRAGDAQASEELVRRYEPVIRVAIRTRLNDSGLRAVLDSTDICQSILAIFFARAAAGQFDLETPEHLVKLLVTMARNRLANHIAQQRALRRDQRRNQPTDAANLCDPSASPSDLASARELLELVKKRLAPEESRLADLRAQGKTWSEISQEVGGKPDALRMSLDRAVDRIMNELQPDA